MSICRLYHPDMENTNSSAISPAGRWDNFRRNKSAPVTAISGQSCGFSHVSEPKRDPVLPNTIVTRESSP